MEAGVSRACAIQNPFGRMNIMTVIGGHPLRQLDGSGGPESWLQTMWMPCNSHPDAETRAMSGGDSRRGEAERDRDNEKTIECLKWQR
jgi:hypothetical protein